VSTLLNRVRKGFYLDSVALMRLSRDISERPDVEAAALMIGSASNKDLLRDAGLLAEAGRDAQANDLVIAVRAADEAAAEAAAQTAEAALDQGTARTGGGTEWRPRSLGTALESLPSANLALISVPGEFAAAEARAALRRGLHVMVFSDNVSVEDECALKREALERGRLLMGPDCGTAVIAGVPLAFANEVPRGRIGVISASGTGLQEVSCLIARGGAGLSHGIGVGGRDLSDRVGGMMTLAALDALDRDAGTERIVLISKPPSADVAGRVLERVAESTKCFTICFLGAGAMEVPTNAALTPTLKEAALDALEGQGGWFFDPLELAGQVASAGSRSGADVRGLYCGGTLCAEAQIVLGAAGERVRSNAPVPGAGRVAGKDLAGHCLLDLGADEYTVGRPHPMIDPALRDEMLARALEDPAVGAVLLDVVIGYGAHEDPAAGVAAVLGTAPARRPAVVASVCGTDGDPQGHAEQAARLREAGVLVAPSNADAAALAGAIVAHLRGCRRSES